MYLEEKMGGQADAASLRRAIGRLPGGAKLSEAVKSTYLDCDHFIDIGARAVVQQVGVIHGSAQRSEMQTCGFMQKCALVNI